MVDGLSGKSILELLDITDEIILFHDKEAETQRNHVILSSHSWSILIQNKTLIRRKRDFTFFSSKSNAAETWG